MGNGDTGRGYDEQDGYESSTGMCTRTDARGGRGACTEAGAGVGEV